MGNDRDDLPAIWTGVSFWSVFSDYLAIHAEYTNHRRHFENPSGRRLLFELWRRKFSTSSSLSNAGAVLKLLSSQEEEGRSYHYQKRAAADNYLKSLLELAVYRN